MHNVSILIPAYNEERNIQKIIEEYFHQKLPNGAEKEIIVCANSCTDRTEGIVRQMQKEYDGLRLLTSGTTGKAAALNFLVQEAKYNFLVFSDADIIPSDGMLMHLYEDLVSNPEIKVVGASPRCEISKKINLMDVINSIHEKCPPKKKISGILYAMRKEEYISVPDYIINEDGWINIMFDGAIKKNKDAIAYFKRPQTIEDYVKYRTRIEIGREQLKSMRNGNKKNEKESFKAKLDFFKTLTIDEILASPILLGFFYYARFAGKINYKKNLKYKGWEQIKSTKGENIKKEDIFVKALRGINIL